MGWPSRAVASHACQLPSLSLTLEKLKPAPSKESSLTDSYISQTS